MYIRIIVCFVIYITYTYVRRARALGLKNFNAKFKKKNIFIQAYIYLDFICFIVLKINSINTLLLNVLNCKMNGIKLFIMFE